MHYHHTAHSTRFVPAQTRLNAYVWSIHALMHIIRAFILKYDNFRGNYFIFVNILPISLHSCAYSCTIPLTNTSNVFIHIVVGIVK